MNNETATNLHSQELESIPSLKESENEIQNPIAGVSDDAPLPTRWEIELEFVQSLANIPYLTYLVQNGYLKNDKFINYLKYLTYWQDSRYSKHIVYPDCLHILKLLQIEKFRNDLSNTPISNTLFTDMVKLWKDETIIDVNGSGSGSGSGSGNGNGESAIPESKSTDENSSMVANNGSVVPNSSIALDGVNNKDV
ncbi:mediator complex subunit [Martiniozyma asiatica (nom. inval.)]|nr:mediator complex subunit [Martiniozyma asiatica]